MSSVEGDTVHLDVDHWFKGGDAGQVVLNAPQGMEALIASIPFEVGRQYLITAYDGNVNYCGFSGPSTPNSGPNSSGPSEPEHLLDGEGERRVRASPLAIPSLDLVSVVGQMPGGPFVGRKWSACADHFRVDSLEPSGGVVSTEVVAASAESH